jgi:hypothetical protein
MPRQKTTIRAPQFWLDAMGQLAEDYGISRTDAIIMAAGVGRRVLEHVVLSEKQMEQLLKEES